MSRAKIEILDEKQLLCNKAADAIKAQQLDKGTAIAKSATDLSEYIDTIKKTFSKCIGVLDHAEINSDNVNPPSGIPPTPPYKNANGQRRVNPISRGLCTTEADYNNYILKALMRAGGEGPCPKIREITKQLMQVDHILKPIDFERTNGKIHPAIRFDETWGFAKSHMVSAGWLEAPKRSYIRITDYGKSLIDTPKVTTAQAIALSKRKIRK